MNSAMPSTNTLSDDCKTQFEKIVINEQQEIACPKYAISKPLMESIFFQCLCENE